MTNRFRNYYQCDCGHEWADDWDCCCDDRCPKCDRAISPHKSLDLVERNGKPFLVINLVEGTVMNVRERPTWDAAADLAIKVVRGQCNTPEPEIRAEYETGRSFIGTASFGKFEVLITQVTDM